jgi:hypothetical protein
MLKTKKNSHVVEKKLYEEKANLLDDLTQLRSQLSEEKERNDNAERVNPSLIRLLKTRLLKNKKI